MSIVLVVNSGSSSLKYQLLDVETGHPLASGLIERIGTADGHVKHTASADGGEPVVWDAAVDAPDHDAAFAVMLEAFASHGPSLDDHAPVAVGHRVVQGGARFLSLIHI